MAIGPTKSLPAKKLALATLDGRQRRTYGAENHGAGFAGKFTDPPVLIDIVKYAIYGVATFAL